MAIPKMTVFKEGLEMEERNCHDLLLQILNLSFDLAVYSKYESSCPEVLITVPKSVYDRLEEMAKHSVFKATNWGVRETSGLPWFEYDRHLEVSTPVRLIVQQGTESGELETKN